MTAPLKTSRIAVLGGAGGIGRALVDHLVGEGSDVVVLDLPQSFERHAPSVKALPIDLLSEEAIGQAFAALAGHWPAVDGFVNLAGYSGGVRSIVDTTSDHFDDILGGNLRGAFLAAKACLPLMAKGGAMVNVASGLASNIRPGYASYSISKAGVIALTKTLAIENAPDIRVNAVAPSAVDTAFLRGGTGRSKEDGETNINIAAYSSAIPLKRLAVPEDIVGPIAFLLSDASRYMTGQVLWVNGGGYMP